MSNRWPLPLCALLLCLVPFLGGGAALADAGDLDPAIREQVESLPDNLTRIEYLEKQVEAAPQDASLHFALGNLYTDEGKLEPAAEHLELSLIHI
mgnify:CR=1 FL=1